ELDLTRMKLRVKRPKSSPPLINSNLVFIIRIDNVKDLIFKKEYTIIEGNHMYKRAYSMLVFSPYALGEHNIFCIEVMRFLGPLKLNKPKAGVLHGKKQVFNDGGDTGNREDKINDLSSTK
ncbi:hypothetical protein HID58_028145, partial [Brassica napus]